MLVKNYWVGRFFFHILMLIYSTYYSRIREVYVIVKYSSDIGAV